MARKSPLRNLKQGSIAKRREREKDVFDLDWLKLDHGNSTVNLAKLYHNGADLERPRIEERVSYVNKIAKAIQNKIKDKRSQRTYASFSYYFIRYVQFCDKNALDPFTEEGFLAYVGDNGELRRLVALNNERPPIRFDIPDGTELGISEVTAGTNVVGVRSFLTMAGSFDLRWVDDFTPFSQSERVLTIPYSTDETNDAVTKLVRAFDSGFKGLEEHYKLNPNSPPPSDLSIDLGASLGKVVLSNKNGLFCSPINFIVGIGYALFSYYTALNQTVILNAAFPLQFEKREMKEKVVKTVSLSLWKARAGRFVESMLTDDNTLFDVNENEFDVAIEKKNGVELAEKLRSLATMYASTEKGAPLFWSCDASGKPVKFKTDVVTRIVERLDIRCRDTTPVNHVLAESIKQALEWKFYSVRLVSDDVGGQFLSKKLIHESDFRLGTESKVSKKGKGVHRRHKQIVLCMSAILAAYNSPEDFYGARYPLVAIKDTDNKFLIVFFTHLDHTESSFRIPVEQEGLLREVESWAMSQNLVENPNNYLFPHLDLAGHKSWRWDSKYLLPSLRTILQPLGIGSGQFYLDITTRRFRALTAKFSYTDDDLGYEGSLVLDNDIATFDRSYANGDPEENQMMLSEALEIAARIFKGETIEEAKKAVLASLKKETLTFDEFKLSGLHINQNGTACNGKPDIDTKNTKETDHHRSAARRAEKLGVGDADKIPCFQEDQCAFCKSAKMVDDVNQVYKMLSFIRLLEDRADLRPDDAESLLEKAAYMRLLIDANISDKTASEAEKMLFNQGIHPLVKTMEIAQLIV